MRYLLILVVALFAVPAHAANTVRATWYGNELAGNRTANGERFNPNGLTAAHRSLPFGTCLLVGNPKTGKLVKVRVNDRGPFTKGSLARPVEGRRARHRHAFDPERDDEALLTRLAVAAHHAPRRARGGRIMPGDGRGIGETA